MNKFLAPCALCLWFLCLPAIAQTTAFSYQGHMKDGGNPASGNYDFEFALFDAAVGGGQWGPTVSRNSLAVGNGIFSVSLDFGNQFPGASRFLEIRVRAAGGGGYTLLGPRQAIQSVPYAVKSSNSEQLGTAVQPAASFNITGDGTAAGTLWGNVVNSTTQYNLFGTRILSYAPDNSILIGGGPNPRAVKVEGPLLTHLEQGGGTDVCRNAKDALSSCSSSLRYKEKVAEFQGGMSIVDRLRPVTFDWKVNQTRDLGLVAEDVAKVEPLLVTHNEKGEIEGVKYSRLNTVFINALKEHEAEIRGLRQQIDHQRAEIAALRSLVCMQNTTAHICSR